MQAPHCAMPQPNLVPVRPSTSRESPKQRRIGRNVNIAGLAIDVERDHEISPGKCQPANASTSMSRDQKKESMKAAIFGGDFPVNTVAVFGAIFSRPGCILAINAHRQKNIFSYLGTRGRDGMPGRTGGYAACRRAYGGAVAVHLARSACCSTRRGPARHGHSCGFGRNRRAPVTRYSKTFPPRPKALATIAAAVGSHNAGNVPNTPLHGLL